MMNRWDCMYKNAYLSLLLVFGLLFRQILGAITVPLISSRHGDYSKYFSRVITNERIGYEQCRDSARIAAES